MATKSKPKTTGRVQDRGSNVRFYPMTADQAMKTVLSISQKDARRIVASKPGKKR